MTKQRKVTFFLTGIFLTALFAIIIGLIEQGRWDHAQNIAVKACVWLIYTFFEVKYNIQLSNYTRLIVITVLFCDSFVGLYLNLYVTSTIFDKILHVFGSYAFSLFAYTLICKLTHPAINQAFRFLFVISLGLSIGAIYEISEFIGDLIFQPSAPSQPSLLDTDLDLIADAIGSLIAAIHIVVAVSFNLGYFLK